MLKIMVLIDTIEFRLLRVTDQYVHETIRIMKLSHYTKVKDTREFLSLQVIMHSKYIATLYSLSSRYILSTTKVMEEKGVTVFTDFQQTVKVFPTNFTRIFKN